MKLVGILLIELLSSQGWSAPGYDPIDPIDPIELTFEACDLNNDGLTKEEILQNICKETLENFFGITVNVFDEIFTEVDSNGDSKITMVEGRMAFEEAETLNRSKKNPK